MKTPRLWALALFLLSVVSQVKAQDLPAITNDQVVQSLAANRADWEKKMGATRPRLFFSGDRLDQMRQRLSADPAGRESILAMARAIAAEPVRTYITPEEEMAQHHITLAYSHEELWERNVGNSIQILALASLLDNSPAILQKMKASVLEACRYPTWGNDGSLNRDLACAHLAYGISMAWDWHHDIWSADEKKLILDTMKARMGDMYTAFQTNGFWAHAFVDNHNQDDMAGLGLAGLAFYDEIPDAPAWLAAARLNFQSVAKYSPGDGGSPEGVPYWSYGRTTILLFIEGTTPILDSEQLYQQPFLENSASYRLYSSVAGFNDILPWGDARSKDFYGPQHLLNRLASEYRDPSAQWLSAAIPFAPMEGFCKAWSVVWKDPSVPATQPPQTLDYHAWVSDVASTRSGWGAGDYTVSIKAGFTNRNHCHLDAGALVFAFGDDWLLTAPGYGKGAGTPGFWDAKKGRWDFYSNATEAENTLLIDGKNQRFDPDARGTIDTFFTTPLVVMTGVDLTQAYSGVTSVRREVFHRRGDYLVVFDNASADHPMSVEWLAQPAPPFKPDGNSLLITAQNKGGSLRLQMLAPAANFQPRAPTSPKIDNRPESIHTQSVQQSGAAVRFVALLQPSLASQPLADLKPEVIENSGQPLHVILHGNDWTDHLFRADQPGPISVGGAELAAQSALVRVGDKGIESCVAVKATSLSVEGIKFSATEPFQIGLQRVPAGGWILDSNRAMEGTLTLPKDLTLVPLSEPGPGALSGRTFRYFLSANGAPRKSADDWLSSLTATSRPGEAPPLTK